jgi:hypothetical protein
MMLWLFCSAMHPVLATVAGQSVGPSLESLQVDVIPASDDEAAPGLEASPRAGAARAQSENCLAWNHSCPQCHHSEDKALESIRENEGAEPESRYLFQPWMFCYERHTFELTLRGIEDHAFHGICMQFFCASQTKLFCAFIDELKLYWVVLPF